MVFNVQWFSTQNEHTEGFTINASVKAPPPPWKSEGPGGSNPPPGWGRKHQPRGGKDWGKTMNKGGNGKGGKGPVQAQDSARLFGGFQRDEKTSQPARAVWGKHRRRRGKGLSHTPPPPGVLWQGGEKLSAGDPLAPLPLPPPKKITGSER